jgi:hypothetical protein
MAKMKITANHILLHNHKPLKVEIFKLQETERIKKTLASVHASMAMEGLKPSRMTVVLGRQYLEEKISCQEAIEKIKMKHLLSSGIHHD